MGNCAGKRDGAGGGGTGGGPGGSSGTGGGPGGGGGGFAGGPMDSMNEDSPEKFGCLAGQSGDAFSTFSAAERLSTADFVNEENLYQRSVSGRTGRKGKR